MANPAMAAGVPFREAISFLLFYSKPKVLNYSVFSVLMGSGTDKIFPESAGSKIQNPESGFQILPKKNQIR
jgi:hypothetical protein